MKALPIALALALTGCAAGTSASAPPAPGSSAPASSAPASARPSGTASAGSASPAPQTGGGSGSPVAPSLGGVVLDRACAQRGVDLQGLTGTTAPGATVGYSTTYVDGSNELTNASYRNAGNGLVKAGPDGRYRAVWLVPAAAPGGDAVIRLIVSPKGSPITPSVTYRVSEVPCR